MALCLADSIIINQGLNPRDLRLRFNNWWRFGYNNSFGWDQKREGRGSVGLGGNISQSFDEFLANHSEYTTVGDLNSSGNGSIMRLAPVPVFYASNEKLAMDVAYKQSKTTHQGSEAAECCRLLACILVRFINAPASARPTDTKASVSATYFCTYNQFNVSCYVRF
jgi:ADP-ribosyl-[dinitrogen reductase] hydrolase